MTNHKPDTDEQVFFYEQEFYVLSSFSSFKVLYDGIDFMTAGHCYHYQKFLHKDRYSCSGIRADIVYARSAHDALQIARENKNLVRPDWEDVKFDVMRSILMAKVDQHEYVARKLLQTGDRELVDGSPQNMLGKLWMEVRSWLRGDDWRRQSQ